MSTDGVKMSTMTADTTVDGTEKILTLDGSTSKTLTTAMMAAYAVDVLGSAAAATPTAGDDIVAFRGADEKLFDLDALSAYVVASAWSVAATVTPLATGDLMLVQRAGTIYDANISTLKTYVLDGIQATVTNISGMTAGTPAAANLILICQAGVGKQCSISALETLLWSDYYTYVKALSNATSVVDSDEFWLGQGAAPKAVTAAMVAEYTGDWIIADEDVRDSFFGDIGEWVDGLSAAITLAGTDNLLIAQGTTAASADLDALVEYLEDELESTAPWRLIPVASYTATPSTASVILMSSTTHMRVGLPVKYRYGNVDYYGIITSVSGSVSITIAGATLDTGVALQSLHVGVQSQVEQVEFLVPDVYGDDTHDLFADITLERRRWRKGNAYLVSFSATHGRVDTGASQPKINVTVNGSKVSTADTSNGIQLGAAGTWVDNGAVAISLANYEIEMDEEIDIEVTAAGANGDAAILSVACMFVYE